MEVSGSVAFLQINTIYPTVDYFKKIKRKRVEELRTTCVS